MRPGGRAAWVAWGLVVGAAFAFGLFLGPFTRSWTFVCRECGALRHTREKQLPRMDVTWWTLHRLEETPLSRLLRESGFAEPHEHAWVRGEGGGNGASAGPGPGADMRKDAESPHVASFLRHFAQRGNREAFLQWKAVALSARPGRRLGKALRDAAFPAEGFPDLATFEHWLQRDGPRRVSDEPRF